MNKSWSTKVHDLRFAEKIISQYAGDDKTLGLFEVVIGSDRKASSVNLSEWVVILATYYRKAYGESRGDWVTKKVVTYCLINGETVH